MGMLLTAENRERVINMCKYVTLASEAIPSMQDVEALRENAPIASNHVVADLNQGRLHQVVRGCMVIFESVLEISLDEIYKEVVLSEEEGGGSERTLSSSAHIGYQLTRCKDFLGGSQDVALDHLLREINYALGNMLYTALELHILYQAEYGAFDDYQDTIGQTSLDMSLEEIYNKDGLRPGEPFVSYGELLVMVQNDIAGLDKVNNPYEEFGTEFFAHHGIEVEEFEDSVGEGPSALSFEEIDDSNLNWE